MSLDLLSKKVASHFEVEEADLKSSNKKKSVVDAKAVFGYLAMKKMPAPCNAKLFHWGGIQDGKLELF